MTRKVILKGFCEIQIQAINSIIHTGFSRRQDNEGGTCELRVGHKGSGGSAYRFLTLLYVGTQRARVC